MHVRLCACACLRIVSCLDCPRLRSYARSYERAYVRECLRAVCDGRSTGPWTRKAPIKQSGGGGRATGGNTGRETDELVAVRVAIGWPSGVAGGARRQPAAYVRTYVGQSDCDRVADSPGNLQTVSRLPQDAARAPPAGHLPPFPALSLSLCLCLACLSTTRRVRPSNCRCPSPPFFPTAFAHVRLHQLHFGQRLQQEVLTSNGRAKHYVFSILGVWAAPGALETIPAGRPDSQNLRFPIPSRRTRHCLTYVRNPTPAGSLAGMCWCHAWP